MSIIKECTLAIHCDNKAAHTDDKGPATIYRQETMGDCFLNAQENGWIFVPSPVNPNKQIALCVDCVESFDTYNS